MLIGKPHIAMDRIARFARLIRAIGEPWTPGNFVFPNTLYLPSGDPSAIDHFFFAVLHRSGRNRLVYRPDLGANAWTGPIAGAARGGPKGIDLVFATTREAIVRDPDVFRPEHLARIALPDFTRILSDASGPIPLSDLGERWRMTREYGAWFATSGCTPATLLERLRRLPDPMAGLFAVLELVPGYRDDPLGAKATLLARILSLRPEHFLPANAALERRSAMDDALVRIMLRSGMITLGPHDRGDNILRKEVPRIAAHRIRAAAGFAAVALARSGAGPIARVELVFKSLSGTCAETRPPACATCPLRHACAKDTLAFQSVSRTTAF